MSEPVPSPVPIRRFGRFANPAWEEAFQTERMLAGRTRSQVLVTVAMLLVVMFGLIEAIYSAPVAPGFIGRMLHYRVFCVAPAWLMLLVASFLPGYARRASMLNMIATILACWGLTLMPWDLAMSNPHFSVVDGMFSGAIYVFLLSALALPMRFPALVTAVVSCLVAPLAFFYYTLPGFGHRMPFAASAMLGVAAVTTALAWYRERAERTMFAQREAVKQLAGQLAELNQEQAEFMAIAAHDLRAPLATVRGFAELLAEGKLKDEAARLRALGQIGAESARMLGLVTDYLGAQAAQGQAQAPRLARTDLAVEVKKALARHAPSAANKQLTLELATNGEPVWAQTDADLLAQITDNLVSNAVKFSPAGKPVRVELGRVAGHARLAVIDAGQGIPLEEQAGLFKKFGRASTRPTGGESSHGLGLAVVKRLAEAMGGRVGCESAPGHGSTFWVELPA